MLSCVRRNFATTRVDRFVVHSIGGEEWFGVNRDGKGMLFTTGPGAASTPVDFMLLTVGACSGDDVKYVLEKNDKKVNGLKMEIEGEWAEGTPRRFKEIRVKYTADSDATKEDVGKVADVVLQKLCPVANTLAGKPCIHVKASLVK